MAPKARSRSKKVGTESFKKLVQDAQKRVEPYPDFDMRISWATKSSLRETALRYLAWISGSILGVLLAYAVINKDREILLALLHVGKSGVSVVAGLVLGRTLIHYLARGKKEKDNYAESGTG